VGIYRIDGVIKTSPISSVDPEMWLPDDWSGRFFVTGNGRLGGYKFLIIYRSTRFISPLTITFPLSPWYQAWIMQTSITDPTWTSQIGTNNSHSGSSNPFTFFMPGKKVPPTYYYGSGPHHSYYNGYSAGGRQGISVAYRYR